MHEDEAAAQRDASRLEFSLALTWWMAAISVLALVMVSFTQREYHGLEDLGFMVIGLAALVLAVVASGIGMLAAGYGMYRSRELERPARWIQLAFAINFLVFVSIFVRMGMPR
jgi:hypothetical protein